MKKDQIDTTPARDAIGEIRYMAHASGYVMARRPGFVPFVISAKEWAALPKMKEPAND